MDDFCVVYLDDILIFFKSEKEHQQHLKLIIKCLQQAELYANSEKYKFFRPKLEYLDFIIDTQGLRMNSTCIQAISEWHDHSPRIYQDIQVFIGFCNFYQHFIYNFAGITQPLHQLLHGMKNGKKPGFIANN